MNLLLTLKSSLKALNNTTKTVKIKGFKDVKLNVSKYCKDNNLTECFIKLEGLPRPVTTCLSKIK